MENEECLICGAPHIVCHYSNRNNQCIGKRCPFSKANE